ncbi:MAG: hypothetical protein ABJO01_05065 [Parasphingorhabdus sp.]|uniref:hypothetical protein n=1 Tax=Parasphingorhabdus sp. TaxID=2709688 RepID=UPI0032972E49
MIVMAALLIAVQPVATPIDNEIVVIGRRLNSISAMVGKDKKGRYTCALDKSSGNINLDKRLCKTTVRCVRDGAVGDQAIRSCVDAEKPKLLAKLRRELKRSRK